jgi:hypothetical protein
VGNPEGRRLLGRLRRRWENDIEIDLREAGCGTRTAKMWLSISTGSELL